MAIYRFEAKVIGRSDRAGGRSVVACAAYRSGTRLHDAKYDYSPNYSRRAAGVVLSEVAAPADAPAWATDREQLWNQVEAKEDTHNRRATAQLAREFIPALPHELSREQQCDLVRGFVNAELVSRGMVCDVSIHEPKDGKNVHAHILCSMRGIGPLGFGKKERDWNDTALLVGLREAWEEHCNKALEDAGSAARVDRRSLADRGIDLEPQPKIGVAATAMMRRGAVADPERVKLARWTVMENFLRPVLRAIRETGEVKQYGAGETWWERAQVAIDWTLDRAEEIWRDESSGGHRPPDPAPSWQDYVTARREVDRGMEPEPG